MNLYFCAIYIANPRMVCYNHLVLFPLQVSFIPGAATCFRRFLRYSLIISLHFCRYIQISTCTYVQLPISDLQSLIKQEAAYAPVV